MTAPSWAECRREYSQNETTWRLTQADWADDRSVPTEDDAIGHWAEHLGAVAP